MVSVLSESFRVFSQEIVMSKFFRRIGVASGVLAPFAANAAVDVSAVTAAGADVTTVGTAVFGVIVLAMVWKWIRRAL